MVFAPTLACGDQRLAELPQGDARLRGRTADRGRDRGIVAPAVEACLVPVQHCSEQQPLRQARGELGESRVGIRAAFRRERRERRGDTGSCLQADRANGGRERRPEERRVALVVPGVHVTQKAAWDLAAERERGGAQCVAVAAQHVPAGLEADDAHHAVVELRDLEHRPAALGFSPQQAAIGDGEQRASQAERAGRQPTAGAVARLRAPRECRGDGHRDCRQRAEHPLGLERPDHGDGDVGRLRRRRRRTRAGCWREAPGVRPVSRSRARPGPRTRREPPARMPSRSSSLPGRESGRWTQYGGPRARLGPLLAHHFVSPSIVALPDRAR